MKDFNKNYEVGSNIYNTRKAIFEKNLAEIMSFNNDSTQSYKKGVNRNTD